MNIQERANAILESSQHINSPYDGDPTLRIVGWVVHIDVAGDVSECFDALMEIEHRAKAAKYKSQ